MGEFARLVYLLDINPVGSSRVSSRDNSLKQSSSKLIFEYTYTRFSSKNRVKSSYYSK